MAVDEEEEDDEVDDEDDEEDCFFKGGLLDFFSVGLEELSLSVEGNEDICCASNGRQCTQYRCANARRKN